MKKLLIFVISFFTLIVTFLSFKKLNATTDIDANDDLDNDTIKKALFLWPEKPAKYEIIAYNRYITGEWTFQQAKEFIDMINMKIDNCPRTGLWVGYCEDPDCCWGDPKLIEK